MSNSDKNKSFQEYINSLDITRFEFITKSGREVISYGRFTFQLQDDGKTLKVFREYE